MGARVIRQIVARARSGSRPPRRRSARWSSPRPSAGKRRLVVNYDELGPGYLSAYGLVAGYFVVPGDERPPRLRQRHPRARLGRVPVDVQRQRLLARLPPAAQPPGDPAVLVHPAPPQRCGCAGDQPLELHAPVPAQAKTSTRSASLARLRLRARSAAAGRGAGGRDQGRRRRSRSSATCPSRARSTRARRRRCRASRPRSAPAAAGGRQAGRKPRARRPDDEPEAKL